MDISIEKEEMFASEAYHRLYKHETQKQKLGIFKLIEIKILKRLILKLYFFFFYTPLNHRSRHFYSILLRCI